MPWKWPPSASQGPFPPLTSVFGGVVGPFWFLLAAGDFPHDASELPGGNTGRCGAVTRCGFDKRSRTLALL